jgi:hypothetical protein
MVLPIVPGLIGLAGAILPSVISGGTSVASTAMNNAANRRANLQQRAWAREDEARADQRDMRNRFQQRRWDLQDSAKSRQERIEDTNAAWRREDILDKKDRKRMKKDRVYDEGREDRRAANTAMLGAMAGMAQTKFGHELDMERDRVQAGRDKYAAWKKHQWEKKAEKKKYKRDIKKMKTKMELRRQFADDYIKKSGQKMGDETALANKLVGAVLNSGVGGLKGNELASLTKENK